MDKIEYLRKLHDIAYQANLADAPDMADEWQSPSMACTHVQPILDIVQSMLSPEQYQMFLDCFGCFSDIAHNLNK